MFTNFVCTIFTFFKNLFYIISLCWLPTVQPADFFNCYLTAPRPTLDHYRGKASITHVHHCVLHFRPEEHWEPRNEASSLSPAGRLMRFEPGTFRFLLQRLNPLGHSPMLSHSPITNRRLTQKATLPC